jgi:hypothetical protein
VATVGKIPIVCDWRLYQYVGEAVDAPFGNVNVPVKVSKFGCHARSLVSDVCCRNDEPTDTLIGNQIVVFVVKPDKSTIEPVCADLVPDTGM